MDFNQTLTVILAAPVILSFLVASISYAYKAWRQTGKDYDDNTIKTLQNAVDALEKENKLLREEVNKKDLKISNMEVELRENTRLLGELKGIVTGDKKLTEVIAMIGQFTPLLTSVEEFKKADVLILAKIDELQKSINNMFKKAKF